MGGDELGSLDLAEELVGITANAVVLDFDKFDETFGVAYESAAVGHAVFLNHHAESAAEQAGGISEHGILDFLDAVGGVMPCLVDEV